MLTFVINLNRDTARLARIEALFGARGLAFTRVEAIDAKALSEAEIASLSAYPAPVSIRLRPGEVACYLSHIKAWRMLLDSDAAHAAIFEDDIDISTDAADVLAAIDAWMPEDADIIKLETSLKPAEIAPEIASTVGGRTLHRLAGCHIGTAGYIISRSAAARMVAKSQRLKMAVDTMLFDPRGGIAESLSRLQLCPALCIQTRLQTGEAPEITSNIAARADHKSYGATILETAANRVKDRLSHARRRLHNRASGVRKKVIEYQP